MMGMVLQPRVVAVEVGQAEVEHDDVGLPIRGERDEGWANPNWEPVAVERVEWMLDPEMDGEANITVYLSELDEDEVGAEYGAIELLLDSGRAPTLDLQP
jgi:hypothetical protein